MEGVIMKRSNKQIIRKRILSALIAAAFVFSCIPSTVIASDFEVDSLNNRQSTSGTAAATNIKVDSENATTSLVVKGTSVGEKVTIYKIASVNYDTVTKKYSDPYWVTPVTDWLLAYDTYSTNGTIC
jgi:hypothetical protein